jgi:hypothetical protein
VKKARAAVGGKGKEPGRQLDEDKRFGHVKPRRTRARFLEFCLYLRSFCPPAIRIAILCGNFSPHMTTAPRRPGRHLGGEQRGIACTPTNSSWLNRVEAQFTGLLRAGRHRRRQP